MRNAFQGWVVCAGLAMLANGCNSPTPVPSAPDKSVAIVGGAASETSAATMPPPEPPRYDQEENGTYYYIAAVSEEDQKKGKAAGDVVGFHYLGKNAKGEHVLASLANDGSMLYKSYCAEPCRVIRQGNVRRGFSSESIIGAAFEDAMAGRLKVYGSTGRADSAKNPAIVSSVPKPFRGAWDEMIADGCRGREARFYIDATKLYNFEAEFDVTGVKVYSPTEIDIRTTYKNESGSQEETTWEFRLADNGKALTGRKSSETFYRRCPESR